MIGATPSGRSDLVGVVPGREPWRATADPAGLGVALLGVVAAAAAPEVVAPACSRRLGEAEVVGPVVHPVVHREQVGACGVDVVARRRGRTWCPGCTTPRTTGSSTGRRSRGPAAAVAVSVPTLKASLLNQLCTANELLPARGVGRLPVAGSTSQASGDADVPTTSSQPRSGCEAPATRVSRRRVVGAAGRWGTPPTPGCPARGRRGSRGPGCCRRERPRTWCSRPESAPLRDEHDLVGRRVDPGQSGQRRARCRGSPRRRHQRRPVRPGQPRPRCSVAGSGGAASGASDELTCHTSPPRTPTASSPS